MHIKRRPPETDVKQLLLSMQLPVSDLTPAHMQHFFAAWDGEALQGVAGIELYDSVGLLRSVAVVPARRNAGIGQALLIRIEQYACELGVSSVYLLTATAEPYFRRHGYAPCSREAAPQAIRETAEFSNICPADSRFMLKHIS